MLSSKAFSHGVANLVIMAKIFKSKLNERETMLKKSEFGTVSVVGLGYIGLPTAAIFASRGIKVIGVDVDTRVVETINRGEIHIVEPELEMVVKQVVKDGFLKAVLTPEQSDVFLIAVPTPFIGADHAPNLAFIKAAARAIAPMLSPGNLVLLESTSPVGTTELLAKWMAEERSDLTFPQQAGEHSDIRVAHCPERVLPGKIMQELVSNDRVIGGMTPLCGSAAQDLYKLFVEGECVLTTVRTAEMCKLAENAFRDVNIAYANELSMICDNLGIDVWELSRLANRHPRVNILKPGAGVGGHCIAVDPWFIVSAAPEKSHLIRTARKVNESKPDWVLQKVAEEVSQFLSQHSGSIPTIAALGLSFKPDIDDLRESPALYIAKALYGTHRQNFLAVEPNIKQVPDELEDMPIVKLEEALESADLLVVLVAHTAFERLTVKSLRPGQIVIDAVGLIADNHERSPWVLDKEHAA